MTSMVTLYIVVVRAELGVFYRSSSLLGRRPWMGNPFIEWSHLKRIGLFGLLRLNWNPLCDVIVGSTPLDGQSVY